MSEKAGDSAAEWNDAAERGAPSKNLRDECRRCGHIRAAHKPEGCAYDHGGVRGTCDCEGFVEPAREPDPTPPREPTPLLPRTIILMTDEDRYPREIIAHANLVIDQHGVVIKSRHGSWVGMVMAGPEVLEEALPVFPPGWDPEEEKRPVLLPLPEQGFTADEFPWRAVALATLVTAIVAAALACVALGLAVR